MTTSFTSVSTSWFTIWLPINPAPPITSMRFPFNSIISSSLKNLLSDFLSTLFIDSTVQLFSSSPCSPCASTGSAQVSVVNFFFAFFARGFSTIQLYSTLFSTSQPFNFQLSTFNFLLRDSGGLISFSCPVMVLPDSAFPFSLLPLILFRWVNRVYICWQTTVGFDFYPGNI
jgi:hypothetical protein